MREGLTTLNMRRTLRTVVITLAALGLAGLLSNVISKHGVEVEVQKQVESSVSQTARLWHLPMAQVRRLPTSSLRMRTEVTPEGKRITFQIPPADRPPFAYAHAKHLAPFVLRVQYGWAVAGSRMSFGQGGEQIVLTAFGLTKKLRDRPEWSF